MSRAWPIRAIGASVLAAWALAVAGCATSTAEKTAATALSHLATYERDVHAKVRAENDFYESVLKDASERIVDLWKGQQPAQLDEELGRFGADNLDAAAEALAPRLPAFLEATRQAWAGRDQEYQSLLADTLRTLTDSRRKLEVEQAKIAELRNKLQPLSEVASDREMLKILIGFARETKAKLDELKAAGPPPAPGGTK